MVKFWIITDLILFTLNMIAYHRSQTKINLIFAIVFMINLIIWEGLMHAGLR